MARRRLRKSPGSLKAWLLTIALHLVVIGLLVIAFRWPTPSGDNAQVIEAVVVEDQQAKQRQAEAEKKKREAARRKHEQELARKQAEAEKKREAEKRKKAAAASKRAETERKRAEAEQRRLAEERKRKEAEEQKQAQEQRRLEEERQRLAQERQRLQEQKQRLEEERKRKEEEDRQRAEEERKRKEAEEQLAAAVAAEERQREEQARRARALTVVEKYKALIRQKVSRNWARPPGTEKGLQCLVRVRLVPGGEVLQVKIIRSSGSEVFDRSVENAVRKASPLPLPEDEDLFEYFRELEFLFNPGDQ